MNTIELLHKHEELTIEYKVDFSSIINSSVLGKEIEDVDELLDNTRRSKDSVERKIQNLTVDLSYLDYVMSIGSGVISGIIDSFFVGEFSLDRGTSWGKEKVDDFVQWVAKKQGYKGDKLSGAVSFLENNNKIAADLVTDNFGGGKFHHLNDFSHHPTPVGLMFSMLTQFTGRVYGTKVSSIITPESPLPQGAFVSYPVPNGELIGNDIPSKITLGFTKWIFHMVSDMAGSSSSISNGKYGTGLPGPIVSLLKEISAIPIFRDKNNVNNFSQWISKLFNGTLLSERDENGKLIPESIIKFDLRAELGVGYEITRQTIPVVINECIVRGYFFISRLLAAVKEKGIYNWKDYKKVYSLQWNNILPVGNNRTLVRMLTISTGTFTAIDLADASIRSAVLSGANPAMFGKQFVLRVNFVGIGRFAYAVYADSQMGVERWKEQKALQNLLSTEMHLTNAKLYLKQGEQELAEIDATNAVNTICALAVQSVPEAVDSMEGIYHSHQSINKSLNKIRESAPILLEEIKRTLL